MSEKEEDRSSNRPFAQRLNSMGLDDEFNDIVSRLSFFGLSPNLSKIYAYLLSKSNPTAAKTLVAEMGLHRVDAYRGLHRLAGLGIVELHILSPNRYSAVAPNLALPVLLSKYENKVTSLKEMRHDLVRQMLSFRGQNMNVQNTSVSDYPAQISYRVVSGREGYYKEVQRVIRESRKEVLRIVSSLGLQLTSSLGYDKEYRRAANRGVSIRIIGEVNRKNIKEVRKLTGFVQIRHLEGINTRLSVVDGEKTIFGHRFENTDSATAGETPNCLVLADPQFADVSRFLFENLWKLASPKVPQLLKLRKKVREKMETVGS